MVRAAVLRSAGAPLEITEIDLPDPGPGQVRVRLAAAGVCHSDLSIARGMLRAAFPLVLGHEGAGTVVSVGDGVTSVAPGDPVVLNWAPACRACPACAIGEPWLCDNSGTASTGHYAALPDGTGLHPGLGVGAFAEETVVDRRAVLPLPAGVPLASAALLGCAVLTGYGAVHSAARVGAGESVVVYGLGGIGLAVLQAARLAGASPLVAVDVTPEKAELARRHGATAYLLADDSTPAAVRALTGGRGADHAFECVGRGATIRSAWSATRRGGRTTVVGIGGKQDTVSFSALELFHYARTLTACVYGNCDPDETVPVLAGHVRGGRLDLDALITDRIPLDGIPAAFERMAAGRGGRSLVLLER